MHTIGDRIAYLRELKDMSKKELTDALGISNLGRIEKNERTPGLDIVISLADYFNVSTDWLIRGKEKDGNTTSQQCPKCYKHDHLLRMLNKLSEDDKLYVTKIVESFAIASAVRKGYGEKENKNDR